MQKPVKPVKPDSSDPELWVEYSEKLAEYKESRTGYKTGSRFGSASYDRRNRSIRGGTRKAARAYRDTRRTHASFMDEEFYKNMGRTSPPYGQGLDPDHEEESWTESATNREWNRVMADSRPEPEWETYPSEWRKAPADGVRVGVVNLEEFDDIL